MSNISIGKIGEELTEEYLINRGYRIIERNYKNKIGEIDIVAFCEDILVFIEVKTRTSLNFGYPYEAVNRKKKEKIVKTSLLYLSINFSNNIQCRYDIVEVYINREKAYKINHYENAF